MCLTPEVPNRTTQVSLVQFSRTLRASVAPGAPPGSLAVLLEACPRRSDPATIWRGLQTRVMQISENPVRDTQSEAIIPPASDRIVSVRELLRRPSSFVYQPSLDLHTWPVATTHWPILKANGCMLPVICRVGGWKTPICIEPGVCNLPGIGLVRYWGDAAEPGNVA